MTTPRGKIIRSANGMGSSQMATFCRWLHRTQGLNFEDYRSLWQWSVTDIPGFWQSVIDFFEIEVGSPQAIVENLKLPGARWLPGASLSYPEHILRHSGGGEALVGLSQTRERTSISRDQLRDQVARLAVGLKSRGIGKGDVVAGYLPNIPESVVAFLATASLGAIWVSCPPEFGAKAVIDRFIQVQPKLMFATAGYVYGDKAIDRRSHIEQIRVALPSLQGVVDIPYLPDMDIADSMGWRQMLEKFQPLTCQKVAAEHPLYVLFSSGTTGLPKPIIHGHGGILLEHFKALGLHSDIREGDRFFWFSTTGWMLWNFGVSALLTGGTTICFDGNPLWPDVSGLWQLAQDEKVSYFGNSATFFITSRNHQLAPTQQFDLSAIRCIGSTGSPLPLEGFEWLHKHFGESVVVNSVSGGTDICSGFMGASPEVTIRSGELAAPMLGVVIASLDERGNEVIGEPGELVVKTPIPSMPVGFWGDEDGSRYFDAYFSQNPGMWTHGDWVIIFEDGASIVTGRSDATLNRGGVRLGTADFYSVVEEIEGVEDCLVVHLEGAPGEMGRLILFVVATSAMQDKEGLTIKIRQRLKNDLSPRHVPDDIVWLSAIPKTLTGKKIEAPIKKILKGAAIDKVANLESLANSKALTEIEDWYKKEVAAENE